MEGVGPPHCSEEMTDPLPKQNKDPPVFSSEERGVTSSRDDGSNEEFTKKRKNMKRGRKPATSKPPAVDNGLLSKNYLPDNTSQTFRTHRCPKCQRCFKMRSHLQEHLHLHFPDPSLQCPTCERFFTSKSKLRIHQLREAGVKTQKCHLCDYSAVERNSLQRHIVTVHADEIEDNTDFNYPCPVCDESFRQSKSLKNHMKTHNVVQEMFSCIEEGCSFQNHIRKNLLQHITQVHSFTPIECRYHACSAIFKTKTLMETHYRTHLAYHCTDCEFSCSNKRVFVQHQRQGHEGRDELLCEFCDFKTLNPVEFEQHVGHLHANEKIHRCPQCSYVTAHKRGLKRHMLTHSGEKPFKCSECEFRCRDESYLSRHTLTHSDRKDYMCSECGYVTKWKHYLNVHMRKHAGDLRYHCDQCSYRCHRMDQLNSHKLRHQDKSLICEICAYSCKRKYELRNHMIAKHSGANNKQATVYKCKYCTYTTSFRQALQNHENCKHTKLKEFNCALCTYSSFSSISLFLHKRKTHGYVPGDKTWLHNYALKEKEKTTIGNLDKFYKSKEPIAANASQVRSLDASEIDATNSKVDSLCDLDVVSQVVNEGALASPSEEYCTLVLTTLTSNDYQNSNLENNSKNSIDVAVNNGLAPKNASLSSEDEETALDSEQNDLDGTSQNGENSEVENSIEIDNTADFEVKDLKQLDKKQAESMVLEGHVEMLMLPTQNVKKKTCLVKSLRDRKRYSCQKCGAEFKQRCSLETHLKKKCPLIENSATKSTNLHQDNASGHEVVASCSNIDQRPLDNNCNLQKEQQTSPEFSSFSSDLVSIGKVSESQSSEANSSNANSGFLHKDRPYSKNGGKFECKQCRFSSVRLATMERHISICTKKLSKKYTSKIAEENRILCRSNCSFTCREESALEKHAKNECKKSSNLQCSECEFVAKSKLALIRHKFHAHKKNTNSFSCEHCTFSCKLKQSLLQHVAIKHKGAKPYQCRYCKFATNRHYRLDEHESIHTGIGRHKCETCHKTFGAPSKLRQHKLRIHDKKPSHFCEQCDFSGFSQDDVRRHYRRCHLGDLDFNCGQCEAKFSTEIALRNHCKRAHQVSFQCKQCEFVCASKVELNRHQDSRHKIVKLPITKDIIITEDLTYSSKTKHNCELCQFSGKSKKLLAQHLLQEHEEGVAEEKALNCSQCEFICKHQIVLEQHLRSHGGKRVYKCTQCEYSTRNKQKMTWHIRIHTGERPYSCQLCKYTCTDPSRLKLHMRVHEEEKKYLCPECGYKCKWATQLKYHMTKHTGEKRFTCPDCEYRSNRADALRSHRETQHCSSRPFICETCGKSFKTNFILKSHQQQHSDSRPYTCGICQKAFKWPAGLRHHFLSHTKMLPFLCRVCGYRAKQRFQVVKHLRRHHPEMRAEEEVERDAEAGGLTLREALQGRTGGEERV